MDDNETKSLLDSIRSQDEADKSRAIAQIPHLLSLSMQSTNAVLDQFILLIYNLNTNLEKYERLNARNRTIVFRQLLALYAESTSEHQHKQLAALSRMVDLSNSSELLVEIANVLYRSLANLHNKEDDKIVKQAFEAIQVKATINLYSETLLIIHSIWAAFDKQPVTDSPNEP